MRLDEVSVRAIGPALAMLPARMDSPQARVMLLAIGLQESRLKHRRQLLGGPARGLWQFECGSQQSRGGVWGVMLHEASRYWLHDLCERRLCPFHAEDIWRSIETDDVLAAGLARLLLFTDPRRLPALDDEAGAWALYMRTWRPGKPHPDSWPDLHRQAREYVTAAMEAAA